jgi:hypothetical protein
MALACHKPRYSLSDFSKSDGLTYQKIDNPDTCNVDYQTLLSALAVIPEKYSFSDIPNNCGFYAEATHNELEAMGIRSAMAFAIVGNGVHSFNAFDTTDRRRVYADWTEGILSIAEKIDGKYRFVREFDNQTQIQELGYERDFYIFW